MDIYTAMKYMQKGSCACKHIGRALDKLLAIHASGIRNAGITFGQHSVLLEAGGRQEVLCSRFFEQRD